jgi:hypothetical protein
MKLAENDLRLLIAMYIMVVWNGLCVFNSRLRTSQYIVSSRPVHIHAYLINGLKAICQYFFLILYILVSMPSIVCSLMVWIKKNRYTAGGGYSSSGARVDRSIFQELINRSFIYMSLLYQLLADGCRHFFDRLNAHPNDSIYGLITFVTRQT